MSSVNRTTFCLASILAFRMLGLFMVLPVLSLYIAKFPDATPQRIGLALGIYGLLQAVLQIPLGWLSDRVGRKPVIRFGLLIFALGSLLAAQGKSIMTIIMGRALQGCGAIGSSVTAFIADMIPASQRTKAMAIVGVIIGTSFSLAMLLGPLLDSWFGLSSLFYCTAIFACIAIAIIQWAVPSPPQKLTNERNTPLRPCIKMILNNKHLRKVNASISILHAIMTANFIILPLYLTQNLHIAKVAQWKIYLPVLVAAFITMLPLIIAAEKKQRTKFALLSSVMLITISESLLYISPTPASLIISLFLFFTAFNALEALLPSLASKMAPITSKGAVMGLFSTCQFMGIFLGGIVGGILYAHYQATGLLLGILLTTLAWFVMLLKLDPDAV